MFLSSIYWLLLILDNFKVLQLGRAECGCHGWLADHACYGGLTDSPGKENSGCKPYLPCQTFKRRSPYTNKGVNGLVLNFPTASAAKLEPGVLFYTLLNPAVRPDGGS